MQFFDIAGNEIHQGAKSVTVDLNILPTYIKSKGGPKLIAARLQAAKMQGKYPAEILPHDFTQRIKDKGLRLRVDLANRLNRPIKGKLIIKAPTGFVVADNGQTVSLHAGEKKTVAVTFSKVTEDASNQYPVAFTFDTNAGKCTYEEVLNCCVAVKRTMKIDGNLNDWENIPGITLLGKDKKLSQDELAREPWLRLKKQLPPGAAFAELKLAWDTNYVYIAAQVSDSTPQTDKVRMEGRDEDAYFHSTASDKQEPWKSWLEKNAKGQSFAQVPYIYKKKPFDNSYTGDQLQLAFNVTEGLHQGMAKVTDVPWGFHAVPDADYEFCAYLCADGKPELWNLLAPGIPRIHDWPHQPKGKVTTNQTPGSDKVVRQNGKIRIYEIAIPKAAIRHLQLKTGTTFKFSFFVGNNRGPKIIYGADKAVTKTNGLTFHPYWSTSPSCDVEWALIE